MGGTSAALKAGLGPVVGSIGQYGVSCFGVGIAASYECHDTPLEDCDTIDIYGEYGFRDGIVYNTIDNFVTPGVGAVIEISIEAAVETHKEPSNKGGGYPNPRDPVSPSFSGGGGIFDRLKIDLFE